MDLSLWAMGPFLFGEYIEIVKWMQKNELISSKKSCPVCQTTLLLEKKCQHSDQEDEYEWLCPREDCKKSFHLGDGTFFDTPEIDLKNYVLLLFFWSRQFTVNEAAEECGVSNGIVSQIFEKLRKLCGWRLGEYDSLSLQDMRPKNGSWQNQKLKEKIKRLGDTPRESVLSYSDELLWFGKYGKNGKEAFANICRDIVLRYPIPQEENNEILTESIKIECKEEIQSLDDD